MRVLLAGLIACLSPALAWAEDSPATDAYRRAMHQMHEQMMIPYSNDADRDFVAGMIPHHQGAIAMAKIELQYGRDPAIKALAHDIIAAQEREIRLMRQWQAQHR
jgi:uncharacterized protein (DUF305 family)